jgi:hypothetical protein
MKLLSGVLSYDENDYAGIRQCFQSFFEKIRQNLFEDDFLSRDVDEHMIEINDYIMIRMYN